MSWRCRRRRPKVPPRIHVKVDGWVIHDPAVERRELAAEVAAWAARWTASVGLPR